MNAERLAQIAARLEAATPGPWSEDIRALLDRVRELEDRRHTARQLTHGPTGQVSYCCPAHKDYYEVLDQLEKSEAARTGCYVRATAAGGELGQTGIGLEVSP